jgi:PAS domain S-box-containing protein
MNLESLDERLVSLQDTLQQLYAIVPQYCYILSPSFFILNINPAVTRALGYSDGDLAGRSFAEHCAPEHLLKLQELVERWGTEGEVFNEEIAVLAKDGRRRNVLLSLASIRDPDGNTVAVTAIASDDTERKASEEELHRVRQQLRRVEGERVTMLEEIAHLNRAASMGQIAASVAHELAQPLASILSNAQAAARFANRPEPDLEEIRGALTEIIEDDQRAGSFLQNMRAVFQRQKVTRGAIDLNEVLHEMGRILRKSALRNAVQIRLIPSRQPVVVLGDAIAVQQIVLNLANNGIDALQNRPSRERLLTLTTALRTKTASGIIQVEDNGCGIPAEHKPRLFMPFFTTKRDGLGLGLSICRSVIESLDGRITLVEREEPGTLFEVELPLISPESAAIPV